MEVFFVRPLICFCFVALLCPVSVATFSCSGRTGFYPHSSSCSKFFACVHGQMYTMYCPAGLEFSAALKFCDWPSNSGCTIPPVDVDTPAPTPCDMSLICPPHVSYFQYPDWTDCSRYYICMSGTMFGPFSCPDGLFFEFFSWSCAHKEDVTCFNP